MVTKEQILGVLKNVYDPEIPVNIVDLGLVYDVIIDEEGKVQVKMTLTAPGCPVAGMIIRQAEDLIKQLEGVKDVKIELVWDPPWNPEMMSEEAKIILGYNF